MEENNEYNQDELIPPEWIDEDFLTKVVENMEEFNKDLKISTFTIQPACKKGDHYASIMFRATIECTHETSTLKSMKATSTLQVIIKTRPPLDTPKGRNLSETQIFENEWRMYTQVIPQLEKEWKRYGEKVEFAGRLLYATLLPQPVIVLEDLCLAGYDILRGRLFSLNEVEACLRKLAKWHAVSYKLTTNRNITAANTLTQSHATMAATDAMNKNVKGQGDIVSVTEKHQVAIVSSYASISADATRTMTNAANTLTQMQQGLFKQKSVIRTDYISNGVRHMIAALDEAMMETASTDNGNSNGLLARVDDDETGADDINSLEVSVMKLRLLEPHIIAACMCMNDAFINGICGPIYVLNHGDFHTTNLMIRKPIKDDVKSTRKNEELLEENIRFIDFQGSFYGPSAFDLQFASFTLFSKTLRDTKREYLLQYYFDHFLESLKKLNLKGQLPTYGQFQADCKRWRCFELFMIGVFLPTTKLNENKSHNVDVNQIFDSAEYRKTYYRNPDYIRYVCELLPKYLKAGYLEEFEHI